MARNLARDHRVIVMAPPPAASGFSRIDGVEVHHYKTLDVDLSPSRRAPEPVSTELRERARTIERDLRLPVYKAASNYLLYARFVRSYGGSWNYLEHESDILEAYVGAYDELTILFDKMKPEIVFYETLDFITSYMAFAMARARGVFGFEFRFSPLGTGRVFPAFGLFRRNVVLEHLYAHRDEIQPTSYSAADDILNALRERLAGASYAKMHRELVSESSPFNLQRLLPAIANPRVAVRGLKNLRWHARTIINRLWLRHHLTSRHPDGRYVLFFLQHLPEASTCSEAPRWVYQDMVVEQLAVNAPGDIGVVVKEHPRSYGHRGRAFWKPLQDLPNVTICHPSADNFELLSGAEAVVAINGSIGFEGILLGKRVGILGRSSYSIYRGARLLDHPDDIYAELEDPLWRPETMVEERRDFLAAYLQASYEFGHGSGLEIYPRNGGDLWADALRQVSEFTRAHQLSPADFESGLMVPLGGTAGRCHPAALA